MDGSHRAKTTGASFFFPSSSPFDVEDLTLSSGNVSKATALQRRVSVYSQGTPETPTFQDTSFFVSPTQTACFSRISGLGDCRFCSCRTSCKSSSRLDQEHLVGFLFFFRLIIWWTEVKEILCTSVTPAPLTWVCTRLYFIMTHFFFFFCWCIMLMLATMLLPLN